MAQYFQMYPLLACPQGNFGTIEGDGAAAYRYTESGPTHFAYDAFFQYWNDDIIDYKSNYSNKLKEPEVLMSNYPVILIKGTFGLGYGLFTGIPPFNLVEVCKSVKKLIKNPKTNISILPDFPQPCDIIDTDFDKIFEVGEGNFRFRGKMEVDDDDNLVIRSVPYQTTTEAVIDAIIKLVKDKKINGISDIIDKSELVKSKKDFPYTDIKIVIVLKKGAPIEQIKNTIYKLTPMEQTFNVNMELVDGTENVHYNLKGILLDWIDYSREMKTRLLLADYKAALKDYHMKTVMVDILSEKDSDTRIPAIIRKSKNNKEAVDNLCKEYKKYNLTKLQAFVILGWKNSQYTEDSLNKIKKEKENLAKLTKELKHKIYDIHEIDKLIMDDMDQCIKRYGRDRVSDIITVKDSNYIEDTKCIVVITKKGFVKKIDEESCDNDSADYIGELEQGDKALHILNVNNRDSLLVFDEKGKCYKLPVNDIEKTYIGGLGSELSNYINTNEKIISVIKMPENKQTDDKLLFMSKEGIIKKSSLSNYMKVNKAGLIAVSLKDVKNDKIVSVINIGSKNKDIIIYTFNGKGLRFNTKEIPETLRLSAGVIGIKLNGDDRVTGIDIIDRSKKFLVILTNMGNGKKYKIEDFEKTSRGKEGSNLIRMKDKEKIVGVKPVDSNEDIDVFLNTGVETLSINDFQKLTLISAGKSVINLKRGEQIISID